MKKLFPLLLVLVLCLTGCKKKALSEPEYQFPKLDWGMSIEQVQRKYPKMKHIETIAEAYGHDFSDQSTEYYQMETECFGYPATIQLVFQTYRGGKDNEKRNSYLKEVRGTVYGMTDKELVQSYETPLYRQWLNPDYTKTEVTEEQRALAKSNVALSVGGVLLYDTPFISVTGAPKWTEDGYVYQFSLYAGPWIIYNVDMDRPK